MPGPIMYPGRDALFGVPLYIAPGLALDQICQAASRVGGDPLSSWNVLAQRERWRARRQNDAAPDEGAQGPGAFFFMFDEPELGSRTSDGIAIVRVVGALYRGLFWDGYAKVRDAVDDALADRDVRAVLLDIDSPGGRVSGLFELTRHLFAERQNSGKPMWALASDQATSAAYAIGSACQRFLATPSAIVGSIGALMVHADVSKAERELGLAYTEVVSGERKNDLSSHKPLNAEGRATMQALVNSAAEQFFAEVSRYRGIPAEDLRAQEAAVYVGASAVESRLVDGIANVDEALEQLRANLSASRPGGLSMPSTAPFANAASPQKDTEMPPTNPDATTQPAVPAATPAATAPAVTPAAPAATTPAAAVAAVPAVPAAPAVIVDPVASALAAQRELAQQITNTCTLAGRPDLAGAMIGEGLTLAAVQTRLLTLRAQSDPGPVNGAPPAVGASTLTRVPDTDAVYAKWRDPAKFASHTPTVRS